MKKDISANLYQKCLILCNTILLNVLHNLSLTVLLPCMATYWVPDLPNIKGISEWSPLAFHFHICKWCLICKIQQAYKYAIGFVALFNVFWAENYLHIEIKSQLNVINRLNFQTLRTKNKPKSYESQARSPSHLFAGKSEQNMTTI